MATETKTEKVTLCIPGDILLEYAGSPGQFRPVETPKVGQIVYEAGRGYCTVVNTRPAKDGISTIVECAPGAESPEPEGQPELTDAEAIRVAVEDYRAYAGLTLTSPEIRADVQGHIDRLLEIADRLDEERDIENALHRNEPSKPKTEKSD